MARNGSGTYSVVNTFVSGQTITASSHNANWTDIGTEMTNSVAADGQTTMTGALKAANGTVAAPALTFGSDTDLGFYRIGSNNLGLACGSSTKVLDAAATLVDIPVGFSVATSKFTVASASGNTAVAGTLDVTGNVAVNTNKFTVAASTGNTAVAGDLAVTGNLTFGTATLPAAALRCGDVINGAIAESHAASAVTFSLKTAAGTDPSSSDPVICLFRNVTVGTGTPSYISITSALSLTISSGSTLGATNSIPFKVWLVIFNDGGTVRLGAINTVSGIGIYPLGKALVASSTTEGGGGGADSAQVFYTGTGVTSKAYNILGYCSYESGLSAVGTWDAAPTRIQIFGDGVPLPGQEIQDQTNYDHTLATGTTVMPYDNTIPQSGEGVQFMTQAITPTSTTNILKIEHEGTYANGGGGNFGCAIFQDSTADALGGITSTPGGASFATIMMVKHAMLAGTTSSTTFKIRAGSDTSGTMSFNGSAAVQKLGGVMNSYLTVKEIMT